MQAFRDIVKGWFGKLILAVVCLLFVLLGSEALLSLASKPVPIAVVEGEEISRDAVIARAEQQKQFLLQQYKGQIRPEFLDDELLKANVLEGMIKRLLMKHFIDENSLGVPHAFVQKEIVSNPDFQEDGKFSKELFDRLVRRVGLTPTAYLDEIKFSAVLNNFENVVKGTAYATPQELEHVTALEGQQRTFNYARIPHLEFKSEVSLTAEQIKTYYDENNDRYMSPEAIKVSYVEFDQSSVTGSIEVSEAQLAQAYEAYVEKAKSDEKREAAHIMIVVGAERSDKNSQALAEEVLAKAKAGEDFSQLAKAYSDDIGSKEAGGVLEASRRGEFLPALEAAVFGLEEGGLSEVVKTEHGYHVVKLLTIVPVTLKSLEEKQVTLEKELKQNLAQEAFLKLESEITELAFDYEDLSIFKENYGKEVQVTDWILRNKGNAIFQSPDQINALFSDEVIQENRNTGWITINESKGAIAHLSSYRPEAVKPLAEVKSQIEQFLTTQEASEMAVKNGQKIIAKLRAEGNIEETEGVEWQLVEAVDRKSTKAPYNLVAKVFGMAKPAEGKAQYGGVKDGGDYLLIELKGVHEVTGSAPKIAENQDSEKPTEEKLAEESTDVEKQNEEKQREGNPGAENLVVSSDQPSALSDEDSQEAAESKKVADKLKLKAHANQHGNLEFSSFLNWLEAVADIEKSEL